MLPLDMNTRKNVIQPRELSFFDLSDRLNELTQQRDPLQRLDQVVNWEMFLPAITQALPQVEAKGPGGRPPFCRLMLFKALILQRLYNLSDEQLQFQVLDRLSFQRFLSLRLADPVPDQNTFREFREQLTSAGAMGGLFAVFTQHLEQVGLLPKEGKIVDATFVEVPRQRNSRVENQQIKDGQPPAEWSEKKRAHKDVDARWTKKNEETFFGYKDHVKVNVATKFIESAVVTDAAVHDSQVIDELIQPADELCIADSAYSGKPVAAVLDGKGVDRLIVQKAGRNRPLTETDKADNHQISKVRARGEHPFAVLSGQAGRIFMRYIGLARNQAAIILLNLTYNLQRYEVVRRLDLHPVHNV